MERTLISMTITNILMILAVIIGPIAALMIQRYLDKRREADRRRHELFRILWSTRALPGRLQYKHVEALNMVSLDFKGYDAVIDSWSEDLDKLLGADPADETLKAQFYRERDAKFHALLHAISKALDYSFTRLDVEKHFTHLWHTAHGLSRRAHYAKDSLDYLEAKPLCQSA